MTYFPARRFIEETYSYSWRAVEASTQSPTLGMIHTVTQFSKIKLTSQSEKNHFSMELNYTW